MQIQHNLHYLQTRGKTASGLSNSSNK